MCIYFWFFEIGVFLCNNSGCPGTYSVEQAGLEFKDPPACASLVLRLKTLHHIHDLQIIITSEFYSLSLEINQYYNTLCPRLTVHK